MIFRVTIISFVILISISSVIMRETYNAGLMAISAVLFCLSLLLSKVNLISFLIQLSMLGLFHWLSQINWCHGVYLIIVAMFATHYSNLLRSICFGVFTTILYTIVRLSYSPSNTYSYLIIFSDVLSVIIIVLLFHYISDAKKHKELLVKERDRLITHDSLTGLMNIQYFHDQLALLIEKNKNVAVFIIDCTDLKSTNYAEGFQSGNELLLEVASGIKKKFPNADLIARYGGDEFAIALVLDNNEDFQKYGVTVAEDLSKELGINLTFGHAIYPKDGLTENALLSIAEERIYQIKSSQFLKREEHMLRAEKLRLVGELAAGMAHEIRNPLTTIKGFLQLAKERNYNIERWYPLIMDEVSRMSELTSEFLQFSRPHATKFKTQSLKDCILRVIQLTSPRALLSGHEIHYSTNEKPFMVHIDRDKIVQVLLNIVQNGLEAMEANGMLTISVNEEKDFVVIAIHDTGSGIPESELEEIFTPFYTTKENGTGLGLPMCQKTIQDHGGELSVTSVMNEGSTFSIRLPLADSTGHAANHIGTA